MLHKLTPWERLALIVILAVGAWLRFQHTGDIEYNRDQVYPVWQALQTVDKGEFPLVGQGTSVLFANPPLTGYFFVPVIALVRGPVAAYLLTLMLNTFAIWLAYRGLRWLIGTRPALVGAALFAANPWIIEDSRRTWVQSLLPFFVCLVFWALAPVLTGQTRHPRRRTLIAVVGLALVAHTYLLAYALIVPVGLLLIVYRRRVPRRSLIVGGAVFAALMGLFAIGLIQEWDNTTQRAENFTSGDTKLSDEALTHTVRLVTGWEYADARGTNAPAGDADLRRDLSSVINLIWVIALAAGVFRAIRALIRHRQTADAALILLVWCVVPVLMMSYVSRVVHPFYLLLTVPAGHGLAALGVGGLLRHRRSAIPAVVAGVVIVTAAINGLNAVRFAQNTAAYPGEDLPETLPLGEATALGSRLRDERQPGMAVFSAMDEWTPVTLAGETFRVEQEPSGRFDRALLIPPDGALYIVFQIDPDDPIPPPLYAQPAGSPLVLDDGTQIELWRAVPSDAPIDHPAEYPSDVGVTFVGWTLYGDLAPGTEIVLDTYWRIDDLRPDRGVWAFAPHAHLYHTPGVEKIVTRGEVISALTWRPGDLMAQRLTLPVPKEATGPYTLNVGLFDGVRLNEQGTPGINAYFHVTPDDPVGIPIVTGE